MRLSQENRNELKLGRLLSTEKPKNAPKTLEKDLKWTQREEAPRWMQMMAPYKGATAPPNRLEAIILSIVFVAGYYSWFVDPGSFLVNSKNDTHQTEGDEEH
jgi:hypothetical protein